MSETRVSHTSRRARPSATSSPGALLESEIAELERANARLQRKLEETEMQAELRWRADRLLALPLPRTR